MITISDLPRDRWPSPLPLDLTPWWLRLLGFPKWRFRFRYHTPEMRRFWTYVTAQEYAQIFKRGTS